MSLKRGAKAVLKWGGTLGGRLTLMLLLALLVAQAATVFIVIEQHEAERAEAVTEVFFNNLARGAAALNAVPREGRLAYTRSLSSEGTGFWVSDQPALPPETRSLDPSWPAIGRAWQTIASKDKRAAWFRDMRPFSMKYRVFMPPPVGNAAPVDGARPPPPVDGAGQAMAADFDGPPPDAGPRGEGRRGPPPEMPGGRPDRPPQAGGDRPPGPPDGPVRGRNPSYGEAASMRPEATMGSPPTRWRASVQLEDGQWLNGEYGQMAGLPGWIEVLFYQNIVTLLVMGTMIVVGVGLITKRLGLLATAADRVGRGDTLESIPESGTSEVRRLTHAFNTMSLRLRRFIEGRTQMLGAISHDLRTPITGLKLRAELVDDEENRERMLAIIDEIHHLTEATLALAREDSITEKTDRVDITSLIESIVDDLNDVGMDVSCSVERGVSLTCRPFSLRRAIRNLTENGVKYGKRSRIALTSDDRAIRIVIDDDGPGIPEDQLEKALLPFVRLETSRSRETGGAGLGLAITRSIVLNHGGELKLSNRPEGGLRATIVLPKDA